MHQSARIPIGTILLLAPMFANGEVFLYFDTASYLSRPDKAVGVLGEATGLWTSGAPPATGAARAAGAAVAAGGPADHVIGGRSVFYGMGAWLAAAAGAIEAVAVMQAAVTVAALSLLWDLLPERSTLAFCAAVLALAVLTPAGFFAALVTPDAFAPLVILGTALLACAWGALGRGARLFLAALLLFGLLSHTSHVLVAAGMVAAGAALAALWPAARGAISGRGLAAGAGAICLAVGASVAVEAAAKRLTGLDVIARPHLTAHLVDGGPGVGWIARHCGPAGGAGPFAVCAFADRLPADWIAFLFARSPESGVFVAADTGPAARRALSEEDAAFALAVLRDEPAGTAAFLAADALRQVAAVRFDDVPLAGEALLTRAGHFPFGIADGTGGRIGASPAALDRMSAAAEVSALVGAVALAAGLALLSRAPDRGAPGAALLWVGAAVVLGVLLNAAVCGALASPYDRFQSRVIFLVPALAVVVWTALLRVPSGPFRAAPAERRSISQ